MLAALCFYPSDLSRYQTAAYRAHGALLMRAAFGLTAQVAPAFHGLMEVASEFHLFLIWAVRGLPEGEQPGRDFVAVFLAVVR